MEKQIGRWSYFFGLAGAVISLVWRVLTLLGVFPKELTAGEHTLTYDTFLKGALLFLVLTIATAGYVFTQKQGA